MCDIAIFRFALSIFLSVCLLCTSAVATEAKPVSKPEIDSAQMAILYEATTDTILYELQADKQNSPASMTKVMTAILVLEYDPNLSGTMVVPKEAISYQYCSWMANEHLLASEEISVWDLMNYLLISSGNEAATTLAYYVSGSVEAFVDKMNEKAAELGMTNTYYADPHGLSSKSRISARDMLTLSQYAMQNSLFRQIVSTKSGAVPTSNKRDSALSYKTTNRVMDPRGDSAYQSTYAPYIVGIKTGYISAAGYNLACCMERDGLVYYSIVMHAAAKIDSSTGNTLSYHYIDTIAQLDYADQFTRKGYSAGETVAIIRLKGAIHKNLPVMPAEDIYILTQNKNEFPKRKFILDQRTGTVTVGQTIGKLVITDDFGNQHETALLAAADQKTGLNIIAELK